MPQIIDYQGDATIAVDLLFAGLLNPENWSPGDWYVEVTVREETPDGWSEETIKGRLQQYKDADQPYVVIQPYDIDAEYDTGPEVTVATESITKVVVP